MIARILISTIFHNLLTCLFVHHVQCVLIPLDSLQQSGYVTFDDIFLGRCREFQEHLFPELFLQKRIDCQHVLKLFREATTAALQQASLNCTTNPKIYEEVVKEMQHPVPTGAKFLFYSRVPYNLIKNIANGGKRFYFIGNTLSGYTLNDLNWCNTTDFPFTQRETCTCYSSEVALSYWIEASEKFAHSVKGRVHIVLNGSNPNDVAFPPSGVLRRTEIPIVLNKSKHEISGFTVFVAQSVDKTSHEEDCTSSSIQELEQSVKSKAHPYECINDPDIARHEICKDAPARLHRCQFLHSSATLSTKSLPLVLLLPILSTFYRVFY